MSILVNGANIVPWLCLEEATQCIENRTELKVIKASSHVQIVLFLAYINTISTRITTNFLRKACSCPTSALKSCHGCCATIAALWTIHEHERKGSILLHTS